ncbi:glutamate--tRNA ligase family protein [Parapedobacter tibetensis]|uniref:glutamate--tRNA ligase family protein n=1 Tax=Parapedobacter tibetensis TaxID=2972951 RepID=UPI00214D3041|nr:glutamate--tRNA ligase family protein [Parapedobacter tibetensis]
MSGNLAFKRTRIAPTPSGYLHLGNAFSFAITVALAQQTGARIFLRIDDLDRERVRREYIEDIFETLDYLELPWDEGPKNYNEYETIYSQIHRLDLYHEALHSLRERDLVFACDCSRLDVLRRDAQGVYSGTCRKKKLPLGGVAYNWRLDTLAENTLAIRGLDGNTQYTILPTSMRYFVVRRKHGAPAYQLASVIDDVHYGVDFVVRGADLWESTLAQHYLANVQGYMGFLNSIFFHHPLLKSNSDSKLSKSAGATSIKYLREQGKTKAEVYQMIGHMLGLKHPISSWEELTP